MVDMNSKAIELKEMVFGGNSTQKSYSLRLHLDVASEIEAITEVSGKSRNVILTEIIKLGLDLFRSHLSSVEQGEIAVVLEHIRRDMYEELAKENL